LLLDGECCFVEAIGEREPLPAFALEGNMPLQVPVFLEAEEKQPLPTSALEDDALRTKDGTLRFSP